MTSPHPDGSSGDRELEASLAGRCLETEDARIGLSNFVQNGARSPAAFVHR